MEDLTKHQFILLVLLVSFVTSVATGIVTVSLIGEQSAPAVTRTINRVVEKTIEKVEKISSSPAPTQAAAVVTKETIVVKADDLIVEAIEKNAKSLVRIRKVLGESKMGEEDFVALGLVVSKDGLIASDSSILSQISDDNGAPIKQTYFAVLPDGKIIQLKPIGGDSQGLALFSPVFADEKEKKETILIPSTFGNSSGVKLGQTVITIEGKESNTAETGIIATLSTSPDKYITAVATSTEKGTDKETLPNTVLIKTDLSALEGTLGSILLNLSGEVIGMKVGSSVVQKGSYVPSNIIEKSIFSIADNSVGNKSAMEKPVL